MNTKQKAVVGVALFAGYRLISDQPKGTSALLGSSATLVDSGDVLGLAAIAVIGLALYLLAGDRGQQSGTKVLNKKTYLIVGLTLVGLLILVQARDAVYSVVRGIGPVGMIAILLVVGFFAWKHGKNNNPNS